MRDPHVEALRYRLVLAESVDFDNAPPLEVLQDGLKFRIDEGKLSIRMKDHYGTEREARRIVEQLLRAWEIHHALAAGRPELRFEFDRSEIIDRNPPPPPKPGEARTVHLTATAIVKATATASLHVSRGSYPAPPAGFALDADVETLWHRWEGYLAGREPLQAMAYFCLTLLEMHGGRKGAVSRYAISSSVLNKLGELSTETGDGTTARKATAELRPLTGQERAWLEAAVKALIRRIGEVAASPRSNRPQLTMADLPSL